MKKVITILTLVLLTVANTKAAQAQTKEETIAWIKEKLAAMDDNSNIEITTCAIQFDDGRCRNTISLSPNIKWVAQDSGLLMNFRTGINLMKSADKFKMRSTVRMKVFLETS